MSFSDWSTSASLNTNVLGSIFTGEGMARGDVDGALRQMMADVKTRLTSGQAVNVKDVGAVGDGVTDDTTAIQAALDDYVADGVAIYFPKGTYLCTANLSVPVGPNGFADIFGDGMWSSTIQFSGSAVTTGLTFDGVSGYSTHPAGAIRNLNIVGTANAIRGVTITHTEMPLLDHCRIWGFKGAGVYLGAVLMPKLSHCLIFFCGSATEGQVNVNSGASAADYSTTFCMDHCYLATGQTGCIAGLKIDRCVGITVSAGAIESCGIPILICSETENTYGCGNVLIDNVNLENPTSCYIKMGSGWTGTAGQAVSSGRITFGGSVSGATSIPKGVQLYNCTGITFIGTKFGQPGTPTAAYSLEGTGNASISIRANRAMYGNTWPYVTVNGTQRVDATPYADFLSDGVSIVRSQKSVSASGTGQTISCSLEGASVIQGGIQEVIALTSAAATTIQAMSGGAAGARVIILPQDSNATLKHNVGANGFLLSGGADLSLASGKAYEFYFDSNAGKWVQL